MDCRRTFLNKYFLRRSSAKKEINKKSEAGGKKRQKTKNDLLCWHKFANIISMIKNDKMRKSVWMLATTVVAFMSSCLHAELTVLEELDAAEAARGNWKVAAQHYINAFEKFHGGMKTILERNGGKLFGGCNSIMLAVWRKNRTYPERLSSESFLSSSTLATLEPGCCDFDIDPVGCKYFEKNIAPELKQYIWSTLGVKSKQRKLPQAANIWDNRFVKPVAELLIELLTTGGSVPDEEKWPLLLGLYRGYILSEFVCFYCPSSFSFASAGQFHENFKSEIPLHKFNDVYMYFYNELASAILHCTTPSEHANRFCALLRSDEKNKVGDNYYEGALFYSVNNVHLMEVLVAQTNDRETITPIPEIKSSVDMALRRAQETVQQRHDDNARATAESLRRAALWL